jgi:hypothetical protein
MQIDPEIFETAIANTKDEIDRLKQGLATLEKAFEFLRDHPEFLPSSNGRGRRAIPERRPIQPAIQSEKIRTAEGHDLAGKTLIEAANMLLAEGDNALMSVEDIIDRALSRGYRSTHPRNKENDPTKLIRSLRMMMARLPNEYEWDEETGKVYRKHE